MKIDLLSHPEISDLVRTYAVRLKDADAIAEQAPASLKCSFERTGTLIHLLVDHSHFTGKQTTFEIDHENGEWIAVRTLQAVQDAIIGVQTKTLQMLTSVHSTVINSLNDDEIVHSVLQEAMNILPHCDAGVFRLFDEQSGLLVPVSQAGLPEDYADYRLQPNESVSGEVFTTGLPALHNGRQNIINAHRVMRPESQSFMERSHIANALLCVPVVAEGKRLGTLTTLCFSLDGAFSVFDQTVLQSLAAQIAVAYQRSLAYRDAVETSRRLERMRADLTLKNAELDRAVDLHEALLRIFSTGEGLVEQLRAVSALFGVEFRFENVMGTSFCSSGWSDQTKALQQDVEVAETSIGQFQFHALEDHSFQHALFGTLAAFVALDFVRDMSRVDAVNARIKAHFDALAAGIEPDRAREQFGFRNERFYQILIAGLPGSENSDNKHFHLLKAKSNLQRAFTLPNALIFPADQQIVMLFSAPTTAALERNVRALSEMAADHTFCIGASEIYDTSSQHVTSKDQAFQAVGALLRRGRFGLLRHRDMGLELLLEGRGRREVLQFAHQILAPLLRDSKHRVLYETLSRYVIEGKSVARTAKALNIHANTLYQRLTKIETLTGRRIGDAADFTLLSLACQLLADYSGYGRDPS